MDTKALRQKILDLAIRGKLVPQDPNDEPASVLLERIRAQKQQMVKEGKLKAKDIKNDTIIFKGEDNLHYEKFQDGTVKCIEDEIPFEIPEGWAWAKLKHICMMAAGKAKPTNQIKMIPFNGCYPCFGGNGIRGYVDEYNQDGTFSIVGRQGALCGNINIASGKFYATEHAVVTTLFDGIDFGWSNYILEALKLNEYATGAAQPGLSVANVLNVFVPIPPTQEQRRIEKKITDSVKAITSIEESKEALANYILQAKSRILDLAIRGKLVPQDPNDEPASVLLERIRAEKEELIKQGKIKRDKKESIIFKGEDNSYYEKIGDQVTCIDDEIPFELPTSWAWCRLGSLFQHNTGKALNTANQEGTYFEYITTSNVYWDRFELENLKSMPFTETELEKCTVHKGDLLVCEGGDIGRAAIWDKDTPIRIQNHIHRLRPYIAVEVKLYYYVFFLYKANGWIEGNGIGLQGLSSNRLRSLLVPLPPLDEQNKLIKKADALLGMLSNIEGSLS